jgi:gamma-glutamyltranspeptidase/glutathione hydrolase
MVATANPLGTQAGLRLLARGGNAVDALVAAAAAITVAEPYFSSVCGVGTLMVTTPGGAPRVLDYLGRAPRAFDPTSVPRRPGDRGPDPESVCSVGIPSALAAWARVLADRGTRSLAEVLEPAIELAEHGVILNGFDVQCFREAVRLKPEGAATYLPAGRLPREGELLRQPDLARTLRRIAEGGIGVMYEGELASAIVREIAERGGPMTREDLASYPSSLSWTDAIGVDYRGVRVYTTPPPTSAFTVLEALNVMSHWPIGTFDLLGIDRLLVIAEAARAARMDTERYAGDPAFVDVPIAHLLGAPHTAELVETVEQRLGGRVPRPATPPGGPAAPPRSTTTHLAVMDATGLTANMSQSMGWEFGCGVVVRGTGLCLNHALHWGRLEPGHPNQVLPGKRHEWPIAPVQLARDGRIWAALGTPGNYGILTTTAQVISNLVDHGLDVQDAIEAPRFRWTDDTTDALPPAKLILETRFPEPTRRALEERGYATEWIGDWTWRVGGLQAIVLDPGTGWMSGGGDPRRNGYAMGW